MFATSLLLPAGLVVAIGRYDANWIGGAAAITFLVSFFWWRRICRRIHREFTSPLFIAGVVVDRMRAGDKDRRVPDAGAQVVRNLLRRLNHSLSDAIESQALSQAKLMSVEAAFDRIHAVLRSLSEGVIVVGRRGDIVLANPSARELMAEGVSRIEGAPVGDTFPEEFGAVLSGMLEPVLGGDSKREFSEGVQHGNGIFDIAVIPVETQVGGSNFGTLVVMTDVTKSHEVAALKDEFLSSVSHELRTPLTNILAYTEILTSMTDQDPESREFLGIIQTESKRLHRLVDNVLEYSKLETGKVEWNLEDVDLGETLQGCIAAFAERTAAEELAVELQGESGAIARADRTRLQQVFASVLDNALKFSERGGQVRVEFAARGGMTETRIHDCGPGVPEEQREVIFGHLTQLGDCLVDKPSGTGMGLAICVRILEELGGSIRCEDSPLGGACFVIEVPEAAAVPTVGC